MNPDAEYLQRCIELATRGYGFVHPNPMVGCVIVKDGRIVAEGYHKRIGNAHAEQLALKKAGSRSKGATLYVNLEPCVHFGRTPPCTEAIIKAGIRKVVSSVADPNPIVSGKGFQKLRRAGVKIEIGILRNPSKSLNEKFFFFMETGTPFVGVKVAQTLDARIADIGRDSKWISSPRARVESHRLRAGYDAVLVGARTAAEDNPALTVRHVEGKNPVRVVLDGKFVLSPDLAVFETRKAATLLFSLYSSFKRNPRKVDKLEARGVKVIPLGGKDRLDIDELLDVLASRGITSLLVEGGSQTIASFVAARKVNKFHCFISPKLLGAGIDSFSFDPAFRLRKPVRLVRTIFRSAGSDYLFEGYPEFP